MREGQAARLRAVEDSSSADKGSCGGGSGSVTPRSDQLESADVARW